MRAVRGWDRGFRRGRGKVSYGRVQSPNERGKILWSLFHAGGRRAYRYERSACRDWKQVRQKTGRLGSGSKLIFAGPPQALHTAENI